MKFSVVGIMYNEGKRLGRALSQFKGYTDDIVIFNTESSDNTEEVAKKFTDKIWTVPYVAYTSSYDCQAWLKAKYDWCFCICGDEEYGEIIDWVVSLDENIKETAIAFHRKEFLDGVSQPFDLSWHTRVLHRHRSWTYELLDPPFHVCNEMLYCSDKNIIHIKNSEEMGIDRRHRYIASKLLAEKYKFTKLFPYNIYVPAYVNYVGSEVSSKSNKEIIEL